MTNGCIGNINEMLTVKEKLSLTTDLLRELRQAIVICESSLGKISMKQLKHHK
jgi:hypothetical protein